MTTSIKQLLALCDLNYYFPSQCISYQSDIFFSVLFLVYEIKNESYTTITQCFQYFSSLPVLHYLVGTFFLSKFEKKIHEYLLQHSLKSGGTKDHFRRVKVPDTTSY